MPVRGRRIDRAAEITTRIRLAVGTDLREARRGAGLTQRSAGGAVGMSHSQVGRIERGDIQDPSIGQLVRLAAALGMDLTVRAYPVADAIRDAAHVRLLDRLRRELPSSVTWRTEVPLPEPGDRRAWDAVIAGSGWRVHVEAETRIADMQALQRRLTIKIRDGGADRLILLVARTRANRAALAGSGGSLLAQFPLPERDVLAALRKGMDPGASGVVCL